MDVREIALCHACVQWLGDYVSQIMDGEVATGEGVRGLFRVRASDETSKTLKEAVGRLDGKQNMYDAIVKFVEGRGGLQGGLQECVNAVASLLKGILNKFEKPLLPFDFCVEDLKEYSLQDASDSARRSEIGSNIAQDIIHVLVSSHKEESNQILITMIVLTGQLFALLCSVSRIEVFEMGSYDLSVPFLPSICGARDPLLLAQEHQRMMQLNQERRAAEAGHAPVPKTRLEVMIDFGQRIWGFMEQALPHMDEAISALRDFDQEEGRSSNKRRRKRDILKSVFKPHHWFRKHDEKGGSAPQIPEPIIHETPMATTSTAEIVNPQYNFRKSPKLPGVNPDRVKSVRLTPSDTSTSLFPSRPPPAPTPPSNHLMAASMPVLKSRSSDEQVAEVGKRLFQRATSDDIL